MIVGGGVCVCVAVCVCVCVCVCVRVCVSVCVRLPAVHADFLSTDILVLRVRECQLAFLVFYEACLGIDCLHCLS